MTFFTDVMKIRFYVYYGADISFTLFMYSGHNTILIQMQSKNNIKEWIYEVNSLLNWLLLW